MLFFDFTLNFIWEFVGFIDPEKALLAVLAGLISSASNENGRELETRSVPMNLLAGILLNRFLVYYDVIGLLGVSW